MFSFKKLATTALAALSLASLPAWSVMAEESAAKPAAVVQPRKGSPSDVMVRVNGTAITRMELDHAVKLMLSQNNIQPPLAPEIQQQAEEAALEQLVAAELLYQDASKAQIKDLDKQIEAKLAGNRAKFGSDADLEKALKAVDMTVKELRLFIRKDIVITTFLERHLAAMPAPSDAEARKFYDENLEKYFTVSAGARASHILIGVEENASAPERKQAREKADAILKRLKAGEDFATLAKSESSCPSSAQGGDLGSFGPGQMVPAFEKAAFALKPGEMSEVVETKFGYHIIKLTEKHEASTEKFESVKVKIKEFLKQETAEKALAEHIEALRKAAKIEKA